MEGWSNNFLMVCVIAVIAGGLYAGTQIGWLFWDFNQYGISPFLVDQLGLSYQDVIESKPFSEEEIVNKSMNFTRNYPGTIKGNWEPSFIHMEKMIKQDSDKIKSIGINTVSVSAEYLFNKDSTYYMLEEDRCISNIVRAKEAGFAVLVSPNFVSAGGHNFEREGVQMTKERYLKISEEISLKWAKISEELNVEFFAPQNEFDGIIRVNFAGSNSEAAEITSSWHKQMLPKLKKVFNGKLMIKLAGVNEEYKTMNASGYDYIGITLFHRNKGLVAFREYVREQYSIISNISERNDVEWLVSEAWFPYGKKIFYPVEINEDGNSLNELQDEYYDISIQEYLEFAGNKPSGYIFCAWLMPGLDVKERPAANSLKAFFGKI